MEQEQMDMEQTQEQTPVYTPRPKWQRALAWIGAIIVIAACLLYFHQIANGGR